MRMRQATFPVGAGLPDRAHVNRGWLQSGSRAREHYVHVDSLSLTPKFARCNWHGPYGSTRSVPR